MAVGVRSRALINVLNGRRLRAARGVATFVALSMTASLLTVAARPERAEAKPSAKPACPDQRADRVSALVTAKLCKKQVEVTGEASETTQVWAKPDGSLSAQVYAGRVRFRQGDRWVPVDLNLKKAADGSITAAAHPNGLRLSGAAGAGRHSLASVNAGDDTLSMQWDGALPEPAISGNRATYREALPGVDVVVEATRSGFEQLLVVKDAAAAARVATFKLPLKSGKLRFVNDAPGAFAIKDPSGKAVGRIPTPLAWDASGDGVQAPKQDTPLSVTSRSRGSDKRRPAVAGAAGVSAAAADAANGTGEVELEVSAEPAWLNDPARKWPVTLDPSVTMGPINDTYVKSGDTVDRSGYNDLQLGHGKEANGKEWNTRPLLQWDTAPLAGARVKWAKLNFWNFYSRQCAAAQWDLYNVAPFSLPVLWDNKPRFDDRPLSSSTETKGFDASCDDGWVKIDAAAFFQKAADAGATTSYMGLQATNETTTAGYKSFRSSQNHAGVVPHLDIDYDPAPILSNPQAAPTTGGCVSGDARPYTTSKTPQLRVNASYENNAASAVRFEWWVTNGAQIGSTTVNNVPSGSTASVNIAAGVLNEGGTYSWRAQSNSGGRNSLWTPWCEFTVDTVKPGAPFVSSTLYPSVTTDPSWGRGGAGQAGQFGFTPASPGAGTTSDVAAFVYQLDSDTAPTTVNLAGVPTTVSITPKEDGRRTLTVRAKDRAGNLSEPVTYVFNAGRAGLSQPQPGANVVKRTKLTVSGDPALTRVTFQYRRGPGGAEYDIPLAHLRKADGSPVTAYPARVSDLGSNAIWNAVDTLGTTGGVAQVRALLYPDADGVAAYQSGWTTINVDTNGDGAAGDSVGSGSVNLLTGDYTVSATDVNEFDLSASRTASSREPTDGWIPQGERLTANLQQVSTDLTGFGNGGVSALARSTARGQGSSTDSLEIAPAASVPGAAAGDVFASVGGDQGALQLGMKPGRRYRFTGWIYVPADTGLTSAFDSRGLRVVGLYKDASGYHEVASAKAGWVDAWQELSVDLAIPTGATEAFLRLYNGMAFGSGKKVYWDNLSLKEVVAPFGPQWRGGAADGSSGNDYTTLTFTSPELAKVTTTGGSWLTFARNSAGQFFPEPGAEDLTLTKVNDTTYQLSDLDGTVTEFTQQGATFAVSSTWTPDTASTSRYLYDLTDNRALVKRVINPTEPGVGDCATTVPARGCEVLEYDYATSTTAAGSTLGDVVDHVRAVKIWSWDPITQVESPVEVARYAYDDQGRLREVWDPRLTNPKKLAYDYDTSGRVVKMTPAGQLPWMFDYGATPGDDNAGRLLKARRAALKQGTKDQLDGEVVINVVYNVPLTRSAGGPHDMDFAAITTWGQKDLPTDATAVFGPESDPDTNSATGAKPGSGGYTYATTHYLNASGQEVNTAAPGAEIDSQQFDEFGNVVWSLEASNRSLALGLLPDAAAMAAELNLPAGSAARAQLLASVKAYDPTGLELLEEWGSVGKVTLEQALAAEGKPTLNAGAQVIAREHTTHQYDQGRPDGAAYHLETTETQGARVEGYPDADVRVTEHGYSAEKGGTSGWKLKKATSIIVDAGPGGARLTSYMVYDEGGRPRASWGIGATGTDARTNRTIYYTAVANGDDSRCGNRPEWADKPCMTMVGGPVTDYDPARMSGDLPVKRVEQYSRFGEPTTTVETAGGKSRRTTKQYDGADRVIKAEVTGDEGVPLPPVTTEYDPVTGDTVRTTMGDAIVTREYDLLGRLITYTDADRASTRTEYDRFGKVISSIDDSGTLTYTYDRAKEPRGMVTSVTDSTVGTFNAKYSADGQLVEMTYPGGITRRDILDASFNPVARVYSRDSDGTTLFSESVAYNSIGKRVSDIYTGGSKNYTYDRVGRLVAARQSDAQGTCVTRTYDYDGRTNRTRKQSFGPGAAGACQAAVATQTESHSYDSADRITDTGYRYDAFGRTTAVGDLTSSYYVNDVVASQQNADTRRKWTAYPDQRLRSWVTERLVNGQWSAERPKINHYSDDTDEPRWIDEGTGISRNVSGPDGDLAAISVRGGGSRLQLTNLHGDVALSIDTALTSPEFYDYDEFGMPNAGQADQRYGWLGGKQRSGEGLGDIILMGVRLYSPATGRFLQVDPLQGGSANAYDYCFGDPVNAFDLDGRFSWGGLAKKAWNGVKAGARFVNDHAGDIGAAIGTVSLFLPPPANLIGGAIALGFSVWGAVNDFRQGKYASGAISLVGAVPGVGAVARGVKAYRAGKTAGRALSKLKRYVPSANSRRVKKVAIRNMKKLGRVHVRAERSAKRWDRWTYPFAAFDAGKLGCKYLSRRCNKKMPAWM